MRVAALILHSLLFLFVVPLVAHAAPESMCPGGSSPNSNVFWCAGFDELSRCSTGRETQCWADNGLGTSELSTASKFYITAGGAAVGSGKMKGRAPAGGTGPGYMQISIPGGSATKVNLRYYMKYTDGYMGYIYDHGPSIRGDGTGGCIRGGTFEQSPWNYFMYNTGAGCTVDTFNLTPNKPNPPVLKNNRWYLIEQQKIIDTSCSNPSSVTGCNGVMRMWIDGQLVMEYTNVNWGGVTNGVRWTQVWGPRSYYHVREQVWEPSIEFDNFVASVNGHNIGAASAENSRGSADPLSPYASHQGIEPFLGRHPVNDCSTPSGYLGTNYGYKWRSGGSLVTEQAFPGGFADTCQSPPAANKSLKVTVNSTGGGGGVAFPRWGGPDSPITFAQQVIHGWLYVPSSNNYSNAPALVGFAGYGCAPGDCTEDSWGNFVSLTVNNGKWALAQRNKAVSNTTQIVGTSSVNVQANTWLRFEIVVWQNQKASVMIAGQRLFDKVSLPNTVNWLFTGTSTNDAIVGVINFTGTAPFSIYFDDVSVGTASFWSCDGWHSSSCPFGGSDTTPPAAPTNLRIL